VPQKVQGGPRWFALRIDSSLKRGWKESRTVEKFPPWGSSLNRLPPVGETSIATGEGARDARPASVLPHVLVRPGVGGGPARPRVSKIVGSHGREVHALINRR